MQGVGYEGVVSLLLCDCGLLGNKGTRSLYEQKLMMQACHELVFICSSHNGAKTPYLALVLVYIKVLKFHFKFCRIIVLIVSGILYFAWPNLLAQS